MPTMPDWPSLWKREPGLIPTDAAGDPLERTPCLDLKCEWHWGYGLNATMDMGTVAALCRDAAISWLAKYGVQHGPGDDPLCICPPGKSPKWEVYWTCLDLPGIEDTGPMFEADTLDEALFIACVAVLDARDAQSAPPR